MVKIPILLLITYVFIGKSSDEYIHFVLGNQKKSLTLKIAQEIFIIAGFFNKQLCPKCLSVLQLPIRNL